jgi:hypothetical protein
MIATSESFVGLQLKKELNNNIKIQEPEPIFNE